MAKFTHCAVIVIYLTIDFQCECIIIHIDVSVNEIFTVGLSRKKDTYNLVCVFILPNERERSKIFFYNYDVTPLK